MYSIEPIAYVYKAELLCPNCTIEVLKSELRAELYDDSSEATIRIIANRAHIDYADQYSYDSDDFPKPILGIDMYDDPEYCGGCYTEF